VTIPPQLGLARITLVPLFYHLVKTVQQLETSYGLSQFGKVNLPTHFDIVPLVHNTAASFVYEAYGLWHR
jgi:hypothetical protein